MSVFPGISFSIESLRQTIWPFASARRQGTETPMMRSVAEWELSRKMLSIRFWICLVSFERTIAAATIMATAATAKAMSRIRRYGSKYWMKQKTRSISTRSMLMGINTR